ncbi:MAG TPA: dTMP kinase [Candidatus Saccharimonadales bacterium]|nr:dTMP kinase [Candidatus Saccharimonadales bacterium]
MKYPVNFSIDFKKNPYSGKLIAIEGIDGSGKTTQAQLLCEKLGARGIAANCTKEPTDEPTGKMIRQVLSGEIHMPPVALQYLFNADRAVHQEQFIKQLEKGEYIITDRYFWSSVAYAIADLTEIDDYYLTVFSLLSFYNRFLIPDSTFYLRVTPKIGTDRIEEMGKKREIYDHEEKLIKIQKGYEFLLEKFPEKFVIIDAEKSIEEVSEEIFEKVMKL